METNGKSVEPNGKSVEPNGKSMTLIRVDWEEAFRSYQARYEEAVTAIVKLSANPIVNTYWGQAAHSTLFNLLFHLTTLHQSVIRLSYPPDSIVSAEHVERLRQQQMAAEETTGRVAPPRPRRERPTGKESIPLATTQIPPTLRSSVAPSPTPFHDDASL